MRDLREKLLDRLHDITLPPSTEPTRGDFDLNPEWRERLTSTELTPAAVLVPIISRNGRPAVLFTQRTPHLKAHAGQVSFPGGRLEPSDDGPIAAALRESEEEIGLASDHVELIGLLDTYQTGTNYIVTPVVGMISSSFEPRLDAFEVAELFEVPLDHVLDRANFVRESRDVGEFTRIFYAIYYEEWRIWGATAGILFDLVERLDRS
ncbi:MAG: CoA pyrophosphatase [Alphaproteobacteria bacterium]|nr:CoA pyrophosphatase [Alphaproteobacteria bacterium]|tara:strand:- start:1043 stop:1663 length:621 start_codon:yes stop_codon:yes gene_type:complete